MKCLGISLVIVVLTAWPALSQQKQTGEAGSVLDRKSLNGFGGHLIVVENPREFIQQWLKPETPEIKSATDITRGASLGAFVLFAGCKPDAHGLCNTEVDYTIYKPDSTVYAERKAQPLWKEQAPPAPNIQLGKAILAFRLGDGDSIGIYKVRANVTDLNAEVSFELETKFRLK